MTRHRSRRGRALLLLSCLAGLTQSPVQAAAPPTQPPPPHKAGDPIQDRWLVFLASDSSVKAHKPWFEAQVASQATLHKRSGTQAPAITQTPFGFDTDGLHGYVVTGVSGDLAKQISARPEVLAMSQDKWVTTQIVPPAPPPPGPGPIVAPPKPEQPPNASPRASPLANPAPNPPTGPAKGQQVRAQDMYNGLPDMQGGMPYGYPQPGFQGFPGPGGGFPGPGPGGFDYYGNPGQGGYFPQYGPGPGPGPGAGFGDPYHGFPAGGVPAFPAAGPGGPQSQPQTEAPTAPPGPNLQSTLPLVDQSANWGLDRIDQRNLPLDGSYIPLRPNGYGANIYILDTGLDESQPQFSNRAFNVFSVYPNATVDDNEHGSHVGGIAAGETYGVMNRAEILGVKVMDKDGTGTVSKVIQGLQWVEQDRKTRGGKCVINLSLGGSKDDVLNQIVDRMVESLDCVVVVAAGNQGKDACDMSPACAKNVISVGNTDEQDTRHPLSNFGRCVDVYAPGTRIRSVGIKSPEGYAIMSGTSMASPFVAGVVASWRVLNPNMPAIQFKQFIRDRSTRNIVKGIPNTGDSPQVASKPFSLLNPSTWFGGPSNSGGWTDPAAMLYSNLLG